ncbi:MAG: hypothetical protein ABIL49_01990 [candidate division WOR-3 bacterium]
MIVLDTILVIANEKFLYSFQLFPEITIIKNISYLPSVYLKERSLSSVNLNYRGLLFNQIKVSLYNFDITDPQTGHHNFNIPLNSLDVSKLILKNQLSFIPITYIEKPIINAKFGQSKDKLFSLFEAKYKNISLSYFENLNYERYFQTSLFLSDFGMIGVRRNEFDATGFFANPSILPFAYETTLVFLSAIKYKNLGFLFRGHYDVFVYDYKKDTLIIKGIKNEHFSSKFQILYSFEYKNLLFEVSYKRDFLSSNIIQKSLNKLYAFRDFLIFKPSFKYKNIHSFLDIEYWIDKKSYLIAPNINVNFGNFLFSITSFSRYPDYTELYYQDPANVSNPNLKPEFYISPEISYENNILITKIFYRYNQNLIDWVYNSDSLKYYAMNLNLIHSIGFELFSKPIYHFQFGISLFKHLFSDTLKYKYLDNTPQLKASILNKFFSFNIFYNEKLSPKIRSIFDIHLTYKFLEFSVEDLFEQSYINEWLLSKRKVYIGFKIVI